ncbi:MAG: delta-60 repeat domain-containing protein [Akkermansiaceae bacterium]|nr:delta-60 repeat domain-containing protein [Akkermansiaceae bacterium]
MIAKTLTMWMVACAVCAAKPGDLDRRFDPSLRAWVAPNHVTIAPDGKAWIGGGFEQADGYTSSDLLKLGENGGVASEPAPGYLERPAGSFISLVTIPASSPLVSNVVGYQTLNFPIPMPFLLASGDFLLPTVSNGWLRMNPAGAPVGKAFPDRQPDEIITPQFEQNAGIYVIRQCVNGEKKLERRRSADGLIDTLFSQSVSLPQTVTGAVPGLSGTVWILTGDALPWFYFDYDLDYFASTKRLFHVDAVGNQIGEAKSFPAYRDMRLVAGPAGEFRVEYGPEIPSITSFSPYYWPSPISNRYQIEWYSAAGILQRSQNFSLSVGEIFTWAEGADRSFLAPDHLGMLQRFSSNGMQDQTFISPGRVRSVKALPNGKWLVDGLRRLNADGSEDLSWAVPELDQAAQVRTLLLLSDGRVLVGGNFATADNFVSNRLAIFWPDGRVDPSFIPDERIGEWHSVAATREAIYVVTTEAVEYGNGVRSNLVKLRMDGLLDESFSPASVNFLGTTFSGNGRPHPVTDVTQVHALPGGDILVRSQRPFAFFFPSSETLTRLNPDGSSDSDFLFNPPSLTVPIPVLAPGEILPLARDGFVKGGVIYRASGAVEKDLREEEISLRPLCEWQGGVLFLEAKNDLQLRLRLWKKNGFSRFFRAPAWEWSQSISAVPGDFGMLYLSGTLQGGQPSIHRLFPNGRIDRSFRSPTFGIRERQLSDDWWRAEESGMVDYDPAQNESRSFANTVLWHSASRSLWTGGNFNVVNGRPRDGVARFMGGFPRWQRRR